MNRRTAHNRKTAANICFNHAEKHNQNIDKFHILVDDYKSNKRFYKRAKTENSYKTNLHHVNENIYLHFQSDIRRYNEQIKYEFLKCIDKHLKIFNKFKPKKRKKLGLKNYLNENLKANNLPLLD